MFLLVLSIIVTFNHNLQYRYTALSGVYPGRALPWREAGPPNHHDDKVDSDQ